MNAPNRAGPTPVDEAQHLRRPRIVLSVAERERLQVIALNALLGNPRAAGLLLDEIDRAEVLPDDVETPGRVRLGSWVKYRDVDRRETRRVLIVETARPDRDLELCVLSPLGVALIGLAAGQSIIASDRRGSEWRLQVLGVTRPHGAGSATLPNS
jgi:regulator of nucleoside diphosphate kinase